MGTGVPKKFAKASTKTPSIELTTRYFPYLFQIFSRRYSTIKTKIAAMRYVIAVETSISLYVLSVSKKVFDFVSKANAASETKRVSACLIAQ